MFGRIKLAWHLRQAGKLLAAFDCEHSKRNARRLASYVCQHSEVIAHLDTNDFLAYRAANSALYC